MEPIARGTDPCDGKAPSTPYIRRRQVLVAAGSVALLGGAMATRSSLADNPARLRSPLRIQAVARSSFVHSVPWRLLSLGDARPALLSHKFLAQG